MKEFLYDRLIKKYENGKLSVVLMAAEGVQDLQDHIKRIKSMEKNQTGEICTKSLFETLKNEAKVILIDEMTLDSLANVPYSDESFYGEIKLPFHHSFFEFEKPLKYTTLEKTKTYDLGAFLFSGSDLRDLRRTKKEKGPEKKFNLFLFDETGGFGNASIYLKEKYMIFGEIGDEPQGRDYIYKPINRQIIHFNVATDEITPDTDIKVETLDKIPDDELNMFKLANLSVNMLNYINAQNVTLRKAFREKTIRMPGGGKKRPKKHLIQAKPYYWVEIKKHVYEENDRQGPSWELDYRVWVRGHFRHYKDGKRIWIEPYVKGPPDAPWKENRYQVLYNRFKHLLKNPKYLN